MGENPIGSARRKAIGVYGENVACAYLVGCGYEILERNWRCRDGELDIVALDAQCLVACEVKTRTSPRFGSPEEAVTPAKVRRLRRLVARWLSERPNPEPGGRPRAIRLDVVAVVVPAKGAATVRHLVGVG